jgi:HPt (histidine-containing phosphotransfer) domain-containing protein
MVPGIDLVEVLIRCTRKMPLMLKLLRRFVVEHEDFGDRLERAASEGLQPLAKLSHRLKGATSLLAMHALSDVALRLEVLAEAGAVDQELAVARTALVEEMNRVLGGLRSWLTAQA